MRENQFGEQSVWRSTLFVSLHIFKILASKCADGDVNRLQSSKRDQLMKKSQQQKNQSKDWVQSRGSFGKLKLTATISQMDQM